MQLDSQAIREFLILLLPTAATLVVVIVGLLIADRLLLRRSKASEPDGQMGRQLAMLGLTVVGIVAVIIALPIDATQQGQLLSLLGLLLSGAIALASTNLLGNIMAGLMLRGVESFRLGDFIEVGQEFGRVSERGLFHVEIQTPRREFTTLPNTYLANNPIRVLSGTGAIVDAQVSLGYDVPRREIEEHLLAAAENAGLEEPFVRVLGLGDHAVTYQVAGLLREIDKLLAARSRVNAQVLDVLHGANVEILSPAFINTRSYAPDRVFVARPAPVELPGEPARDEAPAAVFDKATSAALRERLVALKQRLELDLQQLEGRQRTGERAKGEVSLEQQVVQTKRHLERVTLALEDREPEE